MPGESANHYATSIIGMSYCNTSFNFKGKIEDSKSNKPLNFGNDMWPSVCLLAYCSKTYEWISMKFSRKIEYGRLQVTNH